MNGFGHIEATQVVVSTYLNTRITAIIKRLTATVRKL